MTSRFTSNDSVGSAAAVAGAGLFLGLGLAVFSRHRARRSRNASADDVRSQTLAAYLHDHLSGSDAVLELVDRLRQSRHDSDVARLCEVLNREFRDERAAVTSLLDTVDAAGVSARRVPGRVAGTVLGMPATGEPRELSLLRALEGLAAAVQRKRSLWRTLQAAFPTHAGTPGRSFAQFEAMAVAQWEAIDAQRARIARETFLTPGSFRRADRRQLPI